MVAMENDSEQPLQAIDMWPGRASRGRLLHDMEKAQELMVPESVFRRWCERLRFVIDVRADRSLKHAFELIESANEDEARSEPFVAISYRWPPANEGATAFYQILASNPRDGNNKHVRPIRAPPDILERAFQFAAAKGIRKIWIDQECIHQDSDEDKALGIQSMHIVYRWAAITLVMLGRHVVDGSDIEAIRHLTDPDDRGQNPLRGRIKADSWWTRAWTAQELGLSSSQQLRYLVGWHQELDRSGRAWEAMARQHNNEEGPDHSQNVRREWVLTGGQIFAIAHMMPHTPLLIQTVLATMASGTRGIGDTAATAAAAAPAMSFSTAMSLLARKELFLLSDKLAILGNLADYAQRIDIDKAARRRLGFSACAMALSLYNGDLSPLFTWVPKASLPREGRTFAARAVRPLASWLPDQRLSLYTIATSMPAMDRFRTRSLRGSRAVVVDGKLAVEGLLWKVGPFDTTPKLRALSQTLREAKTRGGRVWLLMETLIDTIHEDAIAESVLEAVVALAMQRQLTGPEELHSIVEKLREPQAVPSSTSTAEKLRRWWRGTDRNQAQRLRVFAECSTVTVREARGQTGGDDGQYSDAVVDLCENLANGAPLLIGRCAVAEGREVACLCPSLPAKAGGARTTEVFSPLSSLDYEFGSNAWMHLTQDERHWHVQEWANRVSVPDKAMETLRQRLGAGEARLSTEGFTVLGNASITLSPMLSSAGLLTKDGLLTISQGE